MKKFILLLALVANTLITNAQEFMGVKVDGSKQHIINQFKAKGFTYKSDKGNTVIMNGFIGSTPIELFSTFTPKSGKCWKITIFLPEQQNWYTIKAEYKKYYDIFKEKYGNPSDDYKFFSSPYYEGDGYEMSALQLEKCTYFSLWQNMYSVEISKFKQVKISYENPVNSALDDKEKKEVNSSIF